MIMTVGGAVYLDITLNALTGTLALLTAFVYLAAYTPLKKVHPICTFVGAVPGRDARSAGLDRRSRPS